MDAVWLDTRIVALAIPNLSIYYPVSQINYSIERHLPICNERTNKQHDQFYHTLIAAFIKILTHVLFGSYGSNRMQAVSYQMVFHLFQTDLKIKQYVQSIFVT